MALTYDLEHWHTQRGVKGSRYYICRVEQQDLFGTWLTSSEWGGLRVGRRRFHEEAYLSYEEAIARFGLVEQQRQRRGYTILFPDIAISGNAEKVPLLAYDLSDEASQRLGDTFGWEPRPFDDLITEEDLVLLHSALVGWS